MSNNAPSSLEKTWAAAGSTRGAASQPCRKALPRAGGTDTDQELGIHQLCCSDRAWINTEFVPFGLHVEEIFIVVIGFSLANDQ